MTINNKFEAKDLAIFLKKNIEWKLFKSLLEHLGNSLNDRKGRFMKSDLIEYSLEIFSNQKVIHIDEQGRDLKIPEKNCYCEVKFEKQLIFTERGQQKKNINVTLINTIGNTSGINLNTYAEYILLLDSKGCALVTSHTAKKYETRVNDQIKSKIPCSEVYIICVFEDIKSIDTSEIDNFKNEFKKLQKEYLEKFKQIENGLIN